MKFFEEQVIQKERENGLALFRVWAIHKEHYRWMLFNSSSDNICVRISITGEDNK